jgi:hypothetical protein
MRAPVAARQRLGVSQGEGQGVPDGRPERRRRWPAVRRRDVVADLPRSARGSGLPHAARRTPAASRPSGPPSPQSASASTNCATNEPSCARPSGSPTPHRSWACAVGERPPSSRSHPKRSPASSPRPAPSATTPCGSSSTPIHSSSSAPSRASPKERRDLGDTNPPRRDDPDPHRSRRSPPQHVVHRRPRPIWHHVVDPGRRRAAAGTRDTRPRPLPGHVGVVVRPAPMARSECQGPVDSSHVGRCRDSGRDHRAAD